MSHKIKWGILGTANIARRRFVPAILKSNKSEIVAIGSRNQAKAEEFANELQITKAYGSYQDVLNDPNVDAVYIPLINDLHSQWTIKAADAGKHILCEKPLALNANEALAMADHCKERGVLLMEAFMYRFNPRTKMIREVIDSGLIGDVMMTVAQFSFMVEPRHGSRLVQGVGAGSLMDVGCYCINGTRYVFGDEPKSVMAILHKNEEFGCDMSASAILEFSNKRTALINCSFETAFKCSLEITGTNGLLKADKFFTPPEQGKLDFIVETSDGKTHHFETDAVDQFLLESDHFADCIIEGKKVLLDPYKDAIANTLVIDAIRKSAETNCSAEVAFE